MPSIDRDPTQEAVLYEWDINAPVRSGACDPAKPLSALFYRNAIASGSIVPPVGESAAVRRSDFLVGCVVCLFVAAGVCAFLVGMLWR